MEGKHEEQEGYRNTTGNRPSNTFVIDELDPFNLGSLIALYEHKTFVQSILWNVNAFDQWGVELGKVVSKTVYGKLTSSNSPEELDSSTDNLIRVLKKGVSKEIK